MRKDNIIWTEIPNKDVLRFGDLSHIQRKKGVTSINDYTEAYLKCEDCDRATKIKKIGYGWDIKGWKSFIRKTQVAKDQTSGYYVTTRVEFYCPSCVKEADKL
jgi:ribosomal protein L37AE/L43A